MTGERVERLRRNHRDEVDSAALYEAMASAERDTRLAGVPADDARALAERIMSDDDTALDAMAREELGIDPEELGGSAAVAAVASSVPTPVSL